MKVAVVVDSAVEVPPFVAKKVFKVPIYITLGEERFRDGERSIKWFFEMMRSKNIFPKTSQPTPFDFEEIYERLLEKEKYDHILSIHISSKLSGTYQSAVVASERFKGKISVVDSENAGFAPGILVCRVYQLLKKRVSLENILKDINELKHKIETIIALENVEFLIRGGRLSGLKALVGSVLKVSPIIRVKKGTLEFLKNVRGMKKAINFIVNNVKERIKYEISAIVSHIESKKYAEIFMNTLAERINLRKSYLFDTMSLTLASHLGPVVGLFIYPSYVELNV